MKKKRSKTLTPWLELAGIDENPFSVDLRSLDRISELYKGYGPFRPQAGWRRLSMAAMPGRIDPAARSHGTRRLSGSFG